MFEGKKWFPRTLAEGPLNKQFNQETYAEAEREQHTSIFQS